MNTRSFLTALLPAALAVGFASSARAAETSALTPEQAAEVRALVQEVLADSGQRATLGDGMYAGIDEKGKIFLKSEDGKFKLGVKGRIQFRYIYNHQNDRSNVTPTPASGTGGEGEDVGGFQLRRAKMQFTGQVGDPKVKYDVVVYANRKTEALGLEEANLDYEISDELSVKVGKFKMPFAREELVSSGKQVAVERSSVNEFYTLNRSEGIQLQYAADQITARLATHNGGNTESTNFNTKPVEYAVTGRVEWQPIGTEKDMVDNFALKHADQEALMFGVAADYEKGNTNIGTKSADVAAGSGTTFLFPTNIDNVIAYTGDVTYKVGGCAFNVAAFGSTSQGVLGTSDVTNWGLAALADFRVTDQTDVFVRWEMLDDGGFQGSGAAMSTKTNDTDRFQAVTVGANYWLNSHVKLTGDVVWVYDGHNLNAPSAPLNNGQTSDGLGLTSFGSDDQQVALRLQVQCEF